MRESIWHEREFDPDAEYAVNKPLVHAGETFERGEKFDKSIASPRNLRILFERRFIVKVLSDQVAESPPPPAPVMEGPGDDGESGSVDDESVDPGASVRPEPTLVTKSGGWYDVMDSEGKILNEKSLRLDEAKKLIEENSHGLDVRRGPGE